ncbi:MAG TPA: hypothetical protein VGG74_29695 [Kofleriaceae bacterium]
MWRSLALVASVSCMMGCSFFAVHGPTQAADGSASDTSCTQSGTIPALDAIVGALAIGGSVGGEIVDQTSHPIHRYELYYGLPALIAGIVLLYSASSGTDKVEACQAVKTGETRGCDGCPADVP